MVLTILKALGIKSKKQKSDYEKPYQAGSSRVSHFA